MQTAHQTARSEPRPKKPSVYDLAEGKWDQIFERFVPEFRAALAKKGSHVPCPHPHHADSKDGFRLFAKGERAARGMGVCNTCNAGETLEGVGLLAWMRGWMLEEAREALEEYFEHQVIPVYRPVVAKAPVAPQLKDEDRRAIVALQRTWRESLPLDHPKVYRIAKTYFASRGLEVPVNHNDLRMHPDCFYQRDVETQGEDGKKTTVLRGHAPAIIKVVRRADGKAVTLHRTYLAADGGGKAWEGSRKMMSYPDPITGSVLGAAIRLGMPVRGVVGIAEGLETALSASVMSGMPVWSCCFAGSVQAFQLPPGVTTVYVWGEKDVKGTGQAAAEKCIERLRKLGVRALAIVPPWPIPDGSKSLDWNDVLRMESTEISLWLKQVLR